MKRKLCLCLALVLSGVLVGCSTTPPENAWQITLREAVKKSDLSPPCGSIGWTFYSVPAEVGKILESQPQTELVPFLVKLRSSQSSWETNTVDEWLLIVRKGLRGMPGVITESSTTTKGAVLSATETPVYTYADEFFTTRIRRELKVVSVDSEETSAQDGHGENAVDGNPNTYWHTQWQSNSPALPHEIVIELHPPAIIKGFTYLPRQDESDHGTIKDFEFYVSDDGQDFGQPVKTGTFEPGKGEKIETFEAIKCRYIKLKAISEINGLPWTSAAEIRVIQSGENPSVKDYGRGDLGPIITARYDSAVPDAIDAFDAAFAKSGGLLMNGVDAVVVPKATTPEEVVSETLRMAKFQTGLLTSYQIMKIREVHLGEFPFTYTAALVDTNLGQMIVLMQYTEGNGSNEGQWWRRIYDTSSQVNRLY